MSRFAQIISKLFGAPQRWRHSRGFGIHSPFAFAFVKDVLCEKYAYYCYQLIENARYKADADADVTEYYPLRSRERQARALFRVANFCNPPQVEIVGCISLMEMAALRGVSKRLTVCDSPCPIDATEIAAEPKQSAHKALPMLVVCGHDTQLSLSQAAERIQCYMSVPCAVVVIGINQNEGLSALYRQCAEKATSGFSFVSPSMAVFIRPRLDTLPHQEFTINI